MEILSLQAYVSILLPNSFIQDVEEIDLKIIILGSVGGILLFLLLGVILWKVSHPSNILSNSIRAIRDGP